MDTPHYKIVQELTVIGKVSFGCRCRTERGGTARKEERNDRIMAYIAGGWLRAGNRKRSKEEETRSTVESLSNDTKCVERHSAQTVFFL